MNKGRGRRGQREPRSRFNRGLLGFSSPMSLLQIRLVPLPSPETSRQSMGTCTLIWVTRTELPFRWIPWQPPCGSGDLSPRARTCGPLTNVQVAFATIIVEDSAPTDLLRAKAVSSSPPFVSASRYIGHCRTRHAGGRLPLRSPLSRLGLSSLACPSSVAIGTSPE